MKVAERKRDIKLVHKNSLPLKKEEMISLIAFLQENS